MVTLPPFHGAGIGMYLFWAIPFENIPIAPAAVGIVTAQEHYIVAQNPDVVSGALVIGTQRFQAALLIEPTAVEDEPLSTIQQAELIERIWPSIQEANKEAPAHARIEKALVLILPGPLLRAGKGTIQRAASIAQYRREIDALYANADVIDGEDDGSQGATAPSIDMADMASVNRFINESVGTVTGGLNPENVLEADLSRPLLGLNEATYRGLHDQVSLIIHNAWPVNFNLGLAAFQPQFAGLVNLFRLAAETNLNHAVRFVFVSSVSAVGGLAAGLDGPVPEKVFTSFDTPYPNGYARSKFLSELLCDAAARRLGTDTMILRVGQVAGAVRLSGGEWNRTEWLPSLVIGSKNMGCLPDNLGLQFSEIDWVPLILKPIHSSKGRQIM
ncbi:putative nrps-like enzyme [Diaporthe ampelina]|uniref:Putative nrps-like enzyme n=1 Tax=Diaporthe ampelina TaxID=1214573 RepID=A0A0G2FFH1_9PEZI|nr:putative nrps-like enzyme [Diaporthe ampelina]